MRLKSSNGEREVAAPDFFIGLLSSDLKPDEILVEISLPRRGPRSGSCFEEIARRRGDFAVAGVAAIVKLAEDGRCSQARLALCGVGETPVDASLAVEGLVGQACTDKAIAEAAAAVQNAIAPPGNIHATADYQRHIAGVLAQRAIATAHERALHAA